MFHPIKTLKKIAKAYYIEHIIGNNLEAVDVGKAQVIVYMSGGLQNHYQFQQWIDPLRSLNDKHPILVVTRNAKLFIALKKEKLFPTVFLKTLNDLMAFYNQYQFPVILYLNNASQNFQSLSYTQGFHIHLNHGESEKESMHSNQSKAYDAVFCVGDRAIERYEEALLNFDKSKYIKIGRPQLDFIEPFNLEKRPEQKVILYAPTWEGHHESMDYCSVKKYGVLLIKKLLDDPCNIVLYKPHSNIGDRRKDIRRAHQEILQLIKKNPNAIRITKSEINNIFTAVDFAFFDNSSVMIDYLFMDKPAFFFNIREDKGMRYLSECFEPIEQVSIEEVIAKMYEHLKTDPYRKKRREIKRFYLGNYSPGESTETFILKISDFIMTRERLYLK